ncbi:MAG: acrylyl-CoA reductase (NADPH), partial [Gammaproteobacteria bacterium]
CATTKYGGTVAACGLAQGFDFPSTVMPFILRGVTLAGIDSVNRPIADRIEAWDRLATDLEMSHMEAMMVNCSLQEALDIAPQQIAGQTRGRVVVNVNQ